MFCSLKIVKLYEKRPNGMNWSPVLVTNLPTNVKDDPVDAVVWETDFDDPRAIPEVADVGEEDNGASTVVLG